MADYLRLTSRQNGSTVKFVKSGLTSSLYKISLNGGEWIDYEAGTLYTLDDGQYIEFMNSNNTPSSTNRGWWQFYLTGKLEASGDITTIAYTEGTDTLVNYCFYHLFDGCTALVKAPDCSRITTLANQAFRETFKDTGITEFPDFGEIDDATARTNVFQATFRGCNNLKKVKLPFKTVNTTFSLAFAYCENLEEFDFGNVVNVSTTAYQQMFYASPKIKKITVNWTDWPSTTWWLNEASEKGEFYCPEELVAKIPSRDYDGVPIGWEINPEHEMHLKLAGKKVKTLMINGKAVTSLFINGIMAYGSGEPTVRGAIAFTSRQDDSTIKIAHYGTDACDVNLEYKIDDNWQPYTLGTQLNIANGWTIYFRNTTGTFSVSGENWISIVVHGAWDVAGELNALLDYRVQAEKIPDYAFNQLFFDDETYTACDIIDASQLKIKFDTIGMWAMLNMFGSCNKLEKAPEKIDASTVQEGGCYSMFYNCALTAAPELPATTLGSVCYQEMFSGCTSLTTAPELPAVNLAESCYKLMFERTHITEPPVLPATTLAANCYNGMFHNCAQLTTPPELPATTLVNSCYQYMFQGCTSLTQAPELPATTLDLYCYQYMFQGCTSLTKAPELPATTLANTCYGQMFSGCTSLTQAPELPAETLATGCYKEMFRNCTSLTTAPVLKSKSVSPQCYQNMFNGCTSLSNVEVYFTTWPSSILATAIQNWLANVAATGTFVCPTALANPSTRSGSTVPSGWTIQKK